MMKGNINLISYDCYQQATEKQLAGLKWKENRVYYISEIHNEKMQDEIYGYIDDRCRRLSLSTVVNDIYRFDLLKEFLNEKCTSCSKKNFKKKFKDGIIAVSFALNVGYSIENAFGQAVDELTLMYGDDSDIVVKFKLIVIRLGQNENLEDILDDFAEESKVEDIMYFAEIFRYAKRSGGDLMAVIKNTAQIIQRKEEVMSEVDTIISGKKMEQRVMSLIPAVIVIYLKVTAKEFIQPLYGNIAGIIIMTVCLAVYVVSDMWAKRIVNIEV